MYYFIFTSGDYDYCIDGLYSCDHKVTTEDWAEFAKENAKLLDKAKEDSFIAYGERTGTGHFITMTHYGTSTQPTQSWYDSEDFKKWEEYANGHDAQELFIKLHGMTRVEYVEINGG